MHKINMNLQTDENVILCCFVQLYVDMIILITQDLS